MSYTVDYDDLDERCAGIAPPRNPPFVKKPIRTTPDVNTDTRTFFIAGVQHRPNYERFHNLKLKPDDVLELVGEPGNKFDRYAVKILYISNHYIVGPVLLGYIPKPINIDLWALRDLGYKPTAHLIEFNPDGRPWEMFKVAVDFNKISQP